ncbi:MAG TPA: DUF5655 domain-containing protein [Blastocatellia bacterium]|nr:DUF5655 domain-containing protein [Blastocatellia bacterium]
MAKRAPDNPYSVHPGIRVVQDWVESLPEKTGRSLDEWITLVRKSGPKDQKERVAWLKQKHGFGTNGASWIAERADGVGLEDSDPELYLQKAIEYVDAQYSGTKAALRPIYDELLRLGKALGKDVRACPGKTIVPLYRRHVFAQIKATTNKRIDLGFALKDTPPTGRLVETGGREKGDRITHRIAITSLGEIDDEVNQWLRAAYDLDQ